jgi:hypothetical protein
MTNRRFPMSGNDKTCAIIYDAVYNLTEMGIRRLSFLDPLHLNGSLLITSFESYAKSSMTSFIQ